MTSVYHFCFNTQHRLQIMTDQKYDICISFLFQHRLEIIVDQKMLSPGIWYSQQAK